MSKQEFAKLQSCVLKVDIQCHCDGCKKKVKKLLQNVDGVYTSKIDADQGKVTVTGNVNPATLIKKLSKSGKHAELWMSQKGTNNFQNQVNNQFKNFQIDAQKTGKDNKSQKGHGQQKGGGGGHQVQQFQHMQQQKGPKEMMKQQKSVKFDMNNEEFDASEDDFDGDLDEFDDDFDDEFDEDDEDDHFFNHQVPKGHQQFPNKMAPMGMMGNGNGVHGHQAIMMNSQAKGGGGGGGKKGGAIDIPVSMKGMGGKNDSKHGNNGNGGGKKGGGDGGGDGVKKGKGGSNNQKQGGKDKNGGKGGILGFLGFGKKSKKKGGGGMDGTDKSSKGNGRVGGSGGNNNGGGAKPGRGKGTDGVHDMKKMKNEFELDVTKPGKGPKGGGGNHGGGNGPNGTKTMGHMGPMGGQMGHMGPMGGQMGQMGNYGQMGMTMTPAAVQGLPAGAAGSMNGGYYHGMGGGGGGGGPVNPYTQQQYMPMMMNQQHPNMSDMSQYQMMHGRPNPAMNYMPPPPMPPHPAVRDPYTHYFSDENTDGGCSIM
ncbi:heavy metal-associated isoprenylated plant protein 33-like isoform X1 [Tripterygium wilfordii]|uniref:heavy metal-associated isoprenylated plant protein 33-like isoform X1 n=1 Tax=Tripterygium wilfordii TaxID=458696 RepID=UPI0018F836E5|nr:heavy metal-associated isoprenylated plant protein 33-like isoform X1 [Tripterygium wilfordii]